MCYFLMAALPHNADVEAARKVLLAHGLAFDVVSDWSVQAHLAPGDIYFCTTRGVCDCRTALGSALRNRGQHAKSTFGGDEIARWQRCLREILEQQIAARVTLLLHWDGKARHKPLAVGPVIKLRASKFMTYLRTPNPPSGHPVRGFSYLIQVATYWSR